MTNYEIYRYIFIGGAILAGIMFAVSVLVFYRLKITTVIGDLTGANARKAIESIRNQNENSGDKTYQTSHVNRERGKITEKISHSGRIIKHPSGSIHGAMATGKLNNNPTGQFENSKETTVLTGELRSTETTLLTEDLRGKSETTLLVEENVMSVQPSIPAVSGFVVEYEITYIHTDEVIA